MDYFIILLLLILIFLVIYRKYCNCSIEGVGHDGFGEWWDNNVRTERVRHLERSFDRGVERLERNAGQIAGEAGDKLDEIPQGVDMAVDAWRDGALSDAATQLGIALTDNERRVTHQFDNNCQGGTRSNVQVCRMMQTLHFDDAIDAIGFIASFKLVSEHALDIIVDTQIYDDLKTAWNCPGVVATLESILTAAILAVAPEIAPGIVLVVDTIGMGIIAACSAIAISDIDDHEKEMSNHVLAGHIQYALSPLITGSEDILYIPEQNYMTNLFDLELRRDVKWGPTHVSENPDEARRTCEEAIDICSEFSGGISNAQMAKKVFDKVKVILEDGGRSNISTKKKLIFATLTAASVFSVAEATEFDQEKCIATVQLQNCTSDIHPRSGEDYRHIHPHFEEYMCNMYPSAHGVPEDIECIPPGWITDKESIEQIQDKDGVMRTILHRTDGRKHVLPLIFPDVFQHATDQTKVRAWHSDRGVHYNNRTTPQ